MSELGVVIDVNELSADGEVTAAHEVLLRVYDEDTLDMKLVDNPNGTVWNVSVEDFERAVAMLKPWR